MAFKIDPSTGEFQVDPATGEFIDDGAPSLAATMDAARKQSLILPERGGSDASRVAMDQSGVMDKPNHAPGTPLAEAVLPRTSAIDRGGPGNSALAYAVDLASLPGRALASAPEAVSGGADAFPNALKDTQGQGFAGHVLRSPSAGVMAAAAPFTGGLSALPALASVGAAGALTSQADKMAQGGEFSLPEAALETGINTAGGAVLGAAGKYGLEALGGLGSKALDAALQKPATQSLLEKLGYNQKLMESSMPAVTGEGAVKNAPLIIAKKLQAYDLLHAPEKANLNLQAGLDKYGNAIAKVIDQGTNAGAKVDVRGVLRKFMQSKMNALESGKGTIAYPDLVNNVMPKLSGAVDLLGGDQQFGDATMEQAVNFKRDLQEMVRNWGETPNKSLVQGVAKELQGSMDDAITAAHPVYGPQLTKLNARFSDLKDVEPMILKGYEKAFQKSAVGADGLDIPHSKYGVMGRLFTPFKTSMDLMPGVADRIANRGASALPDISQPLSSLSPEGLQGIRIPFVQNGARPPPDGLMPRQPITPRRPLDEPQPTYVPAQPVPQAFGKPAPTAPAEPDPMEFLDPRNRANQTSGPGGLENMMPPEAVAAKAQAAQDAREAYVRQGRDVRQGVNNIDAERRLNLLNAAYKKAGDEATKQKILVLIRETMGRK